MKIGNYGYMFRMKIWYHDKAFSGRPTLGIDRLERVTNMFLNKT